MGLLLLNPISLVWLVLMLATAISTWWLPKDTLSAESIAALILMIAAVKVHLVVSHFMELRHAPLRWRIPLEAWAVVCSLVILGIYLATGPR